MLASSTTDDLIIAAWNVVAPSEIVWLFQARQSLQVGDYFFVHAGVRPRVALDKQSVVDSLWIREEFLDSKVMHGAMVVHGHSISVAVEERANRIGIDTGAYVAGRLTALCLEGSERWFLQTERVEPVC